MKPQPLAILMLSLCLTPFTRSAVGADTKGAAAVDDPYTSPRTAWYRDAKYGMFIHWGLYAVPAGEWNGRRTDNIGEWIMHHLQIPVAEYEKFAARFNPTKFDAKEWVRVAKAAGMRYMVITSKHHDGFCLWDTDFSPYNIVDATPFKRDSMKELAEACKAGGIKFAFYHSIMDWHHPELAGGWNANPDAATDPDDPRVKAYVEGQLRPQLKELVTKYDPAILWFDGEWVPWWTEQMGKETEQFLRDLKPDIIVNNRVGKRRMTDGDYETPEQEIPAAALGKRLWETCMTLNDTWGYKSFDHNWKQPADVVRKLADIASKGGNFLLNVGPTAEGEIPPESVRILEESGKWVHANAEAVYGTTFATAKPPAWGGITRKGNTIYAIVFDWPAGGGTLDVPLTGKVKTVRLPRQPGVAGTGKETAGGAIKLGSADENGIKLVVKGQAPDKIATVIVLDFEGEPTGVRTAADRTAAGEPIPVSIDGTYTLPAGAARLHGHTIRVEPAGNLGYWTSRTDYAEWLIAPKDGGRFEVEVTYAVDGKEAGGSEFVVAAGDQQVAGVAGPTGGWQQYTTVKLGTITLPAGKSGIAVKAKEGGRFNFAVMNLQTVKLTPAQ